MDMKKRFGGGDRLKPDDLGGRTITTTITGVRERTFEDGQTAVFATIAGKTGDRECKINQSSGQRLGHAYGWDSDAWLGKRVTLAAAGDGQYRRIDMWPVEQPAPAPFEPPAAAPPIADDDIPF